MKISIKMLFFSFLILVFISGCKSAGKTSKTIEDVRVGTDGLFLSFLVNNPPPRIHVESVENPETSTFPVSIEIRNAGAYPQPNEGKAPTIGELYLSGFDPQIIEFDKAGKTTISNLNLEGKSTINPVGGLDYVSFTGTVKVGNLKTEKYDPIILATACYRYLTHAGPQVCIDPNPYSTVKEARVCEVHDIALSGQGAPVAVTSIVEEALAGRTRFKITVKNVGGGDVLALGAFEKCGPYGDKLKREDIDRVWFDEVMIGSKQLLCGPFTDSNTKSTYGFVRLINGEGSVICEFPKNDYGQSRTSFETPLKIRLNYVYRTTTQKKIEIRKEGDTNDESSGQTIPSPQVYREPDIITPPRDTYPLDYTPEI